MKTKKILAIVMTLLMAMLALAGCGGSGDSAKQDKDAAASDGAYKIGLIQQLEHPALDAATEGFQAALVDILGEDGVEFDLQNAQGEQANCATIASGFASGGVDLIFANATGSLQAAAAATGEIPIVGTSVTDFATALEIDDWTGTTGKNITGTSDLAPLDQQVEMIKELFPDVKQVGMLYCSAEPNSVYQIEQVGALLKKEGIASKSYAAADSNEIQSVTTSAIAECDVLYIPTDNTMAANTEIVNNICKPAKVPVVAAEEGLCKGCGVATLSISYYDLGYAAGEIAADILQNGKDPGEIEIGFAKDVTKEYNEEICNELGIEVPEDYVKIEME